MGSKWANREQKLLRRKRAREQNRFFNDPPVKKKKTKRYSRESYGDDQKVDDDTYDTY